MAERADRTAGGDQGPKEEQLQIHQPLGDVEMEDLSSTQPKPANPDASPSLPSLPPPAQGSDAEPAAASGTTQDTSSTSAEPSAKAQGKAPATTATTENEDLTIDPVEPSAGAGAPDGDIAVEIMLLLTTGARHPFRIDEKYLTKRNVTVTGKTEDGEMDPSSITVYTLKELILRDWRKEWDQPPREPSAIRLIHFGRMLEDRMPLNHYQFSNTSRNVVHMTVKPQDIIDEEEAAKKVKDSGHSGGRSGCCVIL
ncbi:hypothetical protein DL765_011383 [Monosporascus sp. GIB2]|nr:hypothetical protein DL765_011383 [Monosporascus sp. GIB2]